MDAFLVPVGPERYELYCEAERTPEEQPARPPGSLKSRAINKVKRWVDESEAVSRGEMPADAPPGRIRRFVAGKIAEVVAEQRLLWQLQSRTEVRLVHPDDLTAAQAIDEAQKRLRADYDKHLRWTAIDGVLTLAAVPFVVVPGPNVLGYYFLLRTVGHFLSVRGAKRGRESVTWQTESSVDLTRLRTLHTLAEPDRRPLIDEVGAALGLERLSTFLESSSHAT